MRVSGLCAAVAAVLVSLVGAPRSAEAASRKYGLSVFHFNVQYVAGGLVGFFSTPDPRIDKTAVEVEDAIIVQSFEPVLDLFLAHPTWGGDLEMQGYMLDVLGERHPGVLDKLRTLAVSGQVEVMSFHYGDQLFMAYPPEAWRRSQALVRETFERHGVPLGEAVFCQEGQAGLGMAEAMAEAGYETLVFPKNLFAYQRGDDVLPAPLYRLGAGRMLTSRGLTFEAGGDTVDTTFWFVDDGELFATGDYDPYIAEKFVKNPEAIAEHEAELQALEDAGYELTTISKYADAIEALAAPVDPPPLLDGTWQPGSTDGIFRWLGGAGLWGKDERDNDVRTLGAIAQRELLVAEVAAAEAGIDASAELGGGFRLLALGQVSDATGINPFRGEIEYGLAHFTEALRLAREVVRRAQESLGAASLSIDVGTAQVVSGEAPPEAGVVVEPPVALVITAGDRAVTETWRRLPSGESEVTLDFTAGDERSISVVFPGERADLVYTPGLAEGPVSVPRDGFVFEHFDLALSDGLIGLGGGGFVVKDQAYSHMAARIVPGSGEVLFHDETAPAGEPLRLRFRLVQGTLDQAARVARGLNVTPKVWR